MQKTIFVVNDEPYCLWEKDIALRNLEFLSGLDPEYFEYSLNTHIATEDDKRSSIALRVSLHHSIEVLFSLLGAYIQAPDCAYAWIAKYSNTDLRILVERIGRGDSTIFTKLNLSRVTWKTIAELIFLAYKPGTERQIKTIEKFSDLWHALSYDLTNQMQISEYNSLKHGFRVKPGGFALSVGTESKPGITPPSDKMQMLGKSDFGATFFKIETLWPEQKNRSVRSRRISVNWSIERTVLLHQLTNMSINNVVSALKIANSVSAAQCKFLRPENDEDFDKPWEYSPGVHNLNFDYVINETNAYPVSKQELLDTLKSSKN